MKTPNGEPATLIALSAGIVSAYVSNNSVTRADMPDLITKVYAALDHLSLPAVVSVRREPAVPVRRSVTPDFLISLEDGRRYKSLRRHLGQLGLTPDSYRVKWGLPSDYPMVAANYAKQRSELARSMGLGRKPAGADAKPVREARRKGS